MDSPEDCDSLGRKAAAPFCISVSPAVIWRSQRCFLAGKCLMQKTCCLAYLFTLQIRVFELVKEQR